MIDLLTEIMATLRNNKMRTILTGFAVSWGIFLLIVLLSVSRGLVNGMDAMFGSRDFETMSVSGGQAHKPYRGLKDDRQVALLTDDPAIVESRTGNLTSGVAAAMGNDNAVVSTQRDYITQGYRGVYPTGLRSDGGTLISGRFINEADMRERRRVIVIHQDNAETLFGSTPPVGQMVTMCDLSFTVVGTYSHEWNRKCYIPFTTARGLAGGSDTIVEMTVGLHGLSTLDEGMRAEEEVRTALGNRHSFASDDRSALRIWNRLTQHLTTSTAMDMLRIAVWIIGMLTMLSGIVGVSNIMFVSVRERTHEIGIRRAIGARPGAILRQIILESVAITTIFGYMGIVLGVGLAALIGNATEGMNPQIILDPSIDISTALEVTIVLIAAGALAGLFPALKSLKIKPVEALRDE